ncbi:BamA/TamA family outer membrane protein, partial [bacterium]|nr:BamA/TamA family outer membrane protein [bacterium]
MPPKIILTKYPRAVFLAATVAMGLSGVLLCSLGAGPSFAKTPLEQRWDRYDGWELAGFRLEGVPPGIDGRLKDGLALTGKRRLFRGRERPLFRSGLLRDDMARIRLYLAREGYPDAEVFPESDLRLRERRLSLVLRIEAGPPVLVDSVNLRGWPAGPARPAPSAGILPLPGTRFLDPMLEQSRAKLLRLLRNRGFAQARVAADVTPDSLGRAVITFTVTPGIPSDISEVVVSGCSPDLVPLVRRLVNIAPGERYSAGRLEDATFELRASRLFRQVTVTPDSIAPGKVKVVVELENARMRSIDASVGTWSDNPWMVRTGWNHRNLLGGGRGLEVHGAAAEHLWKAGGGLTWIGWLSPRALTRAGVEWITEKEDSFESREWRVDLIRSLRPRGRDMAHTGVSLSSIVLTSFSSEDEGAGDQDSRLLELWADRSWDWADNPLNPRSGGFAKLAATGSPPLGFVGYPYLSAQADLSLYRSMDDWGVLASRVRLGLAAPLGSAEVLLSNRRFYAGGYSTMHGYGRRELGPRDEAGLPLGGNAVILAGTEARIPAYR